MTDPRGREMHGSDAPDAQGNPHCAETRKHLMAFLDGECTTVVRQVMTAHLRECPPCQDRAAFERRIRTIIAVSCRDTAPPSLLQRILRNLSGD